VGIIQCWRNHILISDYSKGWVVVFDTLLNFVRSVGKKGGGPGEFTQCPTMLPLKEYIWMFDGSAARASCFDTNFTYLRSLKLPAAYTMMGSPLRIDDGYLFPGFRQYETIDVSDVAKTHPLVILDSSFANPREVGVWDPDFLNPDVAMVTYTRQHRALEVASDGKGGAFVLQGPSYHIHHLNGTGDELESFGARPHWYKDPPEIDLHKEQSSVESVAQYYGQTTVLDGIWSDSVNRRILVGYINFHSDIYLQRSSLAGDHFMQVYDARGDCVFDGPIPGRLVFLRGDKIYVLTDEKPEYLRPKICRLVPSAKG